MRIWTPEARAAQSALMKKLKPWKKSTGPKTAAGKSTSARNSYKTGLHTKQMKNLRKYMRHCRAYLKFLKTKYYEDLTFLPYHGAKTIKNEGNINATMGTGKNGSRIQRLCSG